MPERTGSEYDERELLVRLAQGDENAFTAIYNLYWTRLYFLAHTHLKSAAEAEEVVQDVFLANWEKRNPIYIHSLPPYLAAMVRYAVYRHLARQKKYPQIDLASVNLEPNLTENSVASDNKELLSIIEKLSCNLPEKCRLVFIHNKLLDKPLSQVANELKISSKTAEAHLTKALKIIRAKFGDAISVFLFFLITLPKLF